MCPCADRTATHAPQLCLALCPARRPWQRFWVARSLSTPTRLTRHARPCTLCRDPRIAAGALTPVSGQSTLHDLLARRCAAMGVTAPALVWPVCQPHSSPRYATLQAIALPTDFSAKLARNTQLILAEETGITHVRSWAAGQLRAGIASLQYGASQRSRQGPTHHLRSVCAPRMLIAIVRSMTFSMRWAPPCLLRLRSRWRRWQTPWGVLSTWRPSHPKWRQRQSGSSPRWSSWAA